MSKEEEIVVTAEEIVEGVSPGMRDRYAAVLMQLAAHHRFNEFMHANYKVVDEVDDEKKMIIVKIEETPTMAIPSLSLQQKFELISLLRVAGCKDTEYTIKRLYKILNIKADGVSDSLVLTKGDPS